MSKKRANVVKIQRRKWRRRPAKGAVSQRKREKPCGCHHRTTYGVSSVGCVTRCHVSRGLCVMLAIVGRANLAQMPQSAAGMSANCAGKTTTAWSGRIFVRFCGNSFVTEYLFGRKPKRYTCRHKVRVLYGFVTGILSQKVYFNKVCDVS